MTRIVSWDGANGTELRLSRFAGTGDEEWVEVRRNLFFPARAGQVFALPAPNQVYDFNAVYTSTHIPVVAGRTYSIRRGLPLTGRFHVVFSELEPDDGLPWQGVKLFDNAAEVMEGLVAPAGANWMHIYLSNTQEPLPDLLVEESPVAGTIFDGDTNPSGSTTRTRWLGDPGESESVVEELVTGTTLGVERTPAPSTSGAWYHLREDGVSLFGRGQDSIAIPASAIKLLTCHIARMYVTDIESTVTVLEADMVSGTSSGFQPGDIATWDSLFHGALVASGNEAAQTIARYAGDLIQAAEGGPSGHAGFRAKANSLIAEWGWRGAVFQSGSGLDVVGRISPRQLCELLLDLDPYLVGVGGAYTYNASVTGPNPRSWVMQNNSMPDNYVTFPELLTIKTGYLSSLETSSIAGLYNLDGVTHAIAAVSVWPAPGRYSDTRTVLNFIESLS